MQTRKTTQARLRLLVIAGAAAAALLVPASGWAGDSPEPVTCTDLKAGCAGRADPAQVQRLAESPPVSGAGTITQITPSEAYKAALEPGTTSEIEKGLTLTQAVGLQPASSVTVAAAVGCWRWLPWVRWGTWPYQQRVNADVRWCAVVGDHITSWSSHVGLDAFLCSPSGPYGYRQVGGVGYGVLRVRAGGYFACPSTIPWLTYHYHRWFDASFYTRGTAAIVATS
jgi:hypothetical protein